MDDCSMLVYSHTEYNDILEICLKRINKYFSGIDLRVCINDSNALINAQNNYNISHIYNYNPDDTYHAKLASVLELIHTKYVILQHDNNIFYDNVNMDTINSIIADMNEYKIDYVRLSACGVDEPVKSDTFLLSPMTGLYYFSVFPCIWNREVLLKLCKHLNKAYRESEDIESQEYTRKLRGYYISRHVKDEYKDISQFYPSVHCIQDGRWCYFTYRTMIFDIATEYDIDLMKRGSKRDYF